MASTYATRTFGTPTSAYKFTISFWVKRSKLSVSHIAPITAGTYQSTNMGQFLFSGDDTLLCQTYNASGNTTTMGQDTSMRFRDTNAWYHIVLGVDGTLATAGDRQKLYVNGELITDLASSTNASQNTDLAWNQNGIQCMIGNRAGMSYYFDGYLSHIHFIDGTQYAASDFGETDATTGEWKINTSPNVTYGNNGFFILKDGNSLTDQSGNGNDFTLGGGTLTKSEDNPSNVFCTLNNLQEPYTGMSVTYSFGNTKYAGDSSDWQRAYGTIGANTGKFFYEFKVLNTAGTSDQLRVGWDSIDNINDGTDNYYSGLTIDTAGKLRGGEKGYNNYDPNAVQMTAAHSGGNFSFTTGDILGMAIDIDNNTFSVYKNGNLEINAYSYASASNCSLLKSKGHFIAPSVNWYSNSGNGNRSCFNFGNGYFESTAISSEGTNASGIGKFEYNVPANYTAFSTKGLNE